MVFSTSNLFKSIPCPEGGSCRLTSCMFGHDFGEPQVVMSKQSAVDSIAMEPKEASDDVGKPSPKKRRLVYDSFAEKPLSKADMIRAELASAKLGTTAVTHEKDAAHDAVTAAIRFDTPQTLHKAVSPPKTQKGPASPSVKEDSFTGANRPSAKDHAASRPTRPQVKEVLNPRLIPIDPAGHSTRSLYLKHLHESLSRLNEVNKSQARNAGATVLNEVELIQLALDEEETIAREHAKLYPNVIKSRIAALKKMPREEWFKWLKERFGDGSKVTGTGEKVIETELTPSQELQVLSRLVVDQKPLAAHGYIPTPPTSEEAEEAAAAVEVSRNYEICDRCSGRFQVFPERNEHGQLTSGGPCEYHPHRKVIPPPSKSDRETGPKEAYFPCCHKAIGSQGCTTHTDHVFKTTSAARLASTLPFITTPENRSVARGPDGKAPQALTFDCEMGFTTHGTELIRLTAVAWPGHTPLLDVLVRPLGAVIDLNSRFSGVFPEHYQNAVPYQSGMFAKPAAQKDASSTPLPLVDSPQKARELLCSFITPKTPLIGHALENDLNAVRLCHPTIVDTVILFPHRRGMPMRIGLKMLSQQHLGRYIQTGGERGHDSMEDAVATGDLVRVKVAHQWKRMRLQGWFIFEDELIAPMPRPRDSGASTHGKKRKQRGSNTSGEGESGNESEREETGPTKKIK